MDLYGTDHFVDGEPQNGCLAGRLIGNRAEKF